MYVFSAAQDCLIFNMQNEVIVEVKVLIDLLHLMFLDQLADMTTH